MKKLITLEINCGKKTCASEPGKFCKFFGTKMLGQFPVCCLFPGADTSYTTLEEVDGWVQRCEECLNNNDNNSIAFTKTLLKKLAMSIGLNDQELWWLIDHDEKIDEGEYKRLMAQGRKEN